MNSMQHTPNPNQIQGGDNITLKDLFIRVQGWWKYLTSKWIIIVSFGLLGGILGLTASFLIQKKYVAELTFILEETNQSPLGAYMGLASQFGIDLGVNAGSGIFSGDNIMQFLKSRLIVEKTLLAPIPEDGKTITLADKYIHFTQMNEGWEKDSSLKDLKFPLNTDRKNFNIKQDSVLNEIYKEILKSKLKVEKTDPKVSFISVKVTTTDELFSKIFAETLVNKAIEFYIDTKTKRAKSSVDRLQGQADSLEVSLNRQTYSVAARQDLNLNPAKQMAGVGTELALRDKMVLQTMYGEVMKNLEMSKMAMAQETPIIQIVDRPILPLTKDRLGKAKGILIGALAAAFLTSLVLLMKRFYKSIMQE